MPLSVLGKVLRFLPLRAVARHAARGHGEPIEFLPLLPVLPLPPFRVVRGASIDHFPTPHEVVCDSVPWFLGHSRLSKLRYRAIWGHPPVFSTPNRKPEQQQGLVWKSATLLRNAAGHPLHECFARHAAPASFGIHEPDHAFVQRQVGTNRASGEVDERNGDEDRPFRRRGRTSRPLGTPAWLSAQPRLRRCPRCGPVQTTPGARSGPSRPASTGGTRPPAPGPVPAAQPRRTGRLATAS